MVAVVSFCLVSLTLYVYVCCVCVCLFGVFFTLYVRIESIESIDRSVGRSVVPSRPSTRRRRVRDDDGAG